MFKLINELKMRIILLAVLAPTAAFAGDSGGGLSGVLKKLTTTAGDITGLLSMVMIVFGMYCIYQLVMTFTNRDEGSRDYPMKNAPFYFIGAALGLGSAVMSDVVQDTMLESKGVSTKEMWAPTPK